MEIFEQVTTEVIKAIRCDRCKTKYEIGTPAFDAFTQIKHRCGYGSAWQDSDFIRADICESCLKILIEDFCRIKTED